VSDSGSSGGLGLGGVLGVVFITLKVLEIEPVYSWGWGWVLSPIWITLLLILFFFGLFFGISAVNDWRIERAEIKRMMDEDGE